MIIQIMPLVSLETVRKAYGHLPLLDGVDLRIEPGERVAMLGRNGSGKSTLLQIVSGEVDADAGTIWRRPGLRLARLDQDVPLRTDRRVFDVVADGLGGLGALATEYHDAAAAVAHDRSEAALARLGRLQQALEEADGWRLEQRVELVVSRLALPSERPVDELSGGWRRRTLLARALVGEPDLLLLDEPTNHLDLDAITWLEDFLVTYPGALFFVTHDRAFLQRLATRMVELDRGRLTSWEGDYQTYLRRKQEALAAGAQHQAQFDRRLAEEEAWLRQGIKARRTRDEGRVRRLEAMRAERDARRDQAGTARLSIDDADPSGRLVFEAEAVSKSYEGHTVIRDFSVRITRGQRAGLIGPNGAGKTTLLKLLLGEIPPDAGVVRRGAGLEVVYYDQEREQLDPDRTVADSVGDGNETVTVGGRPRHVLGYLRDFLFPPERAQSPVRALSGGERNRLLLARMFTRPANVLVLDEPTNDLDLETLELLEDRLDDFPGTVLLVSHDRVFLDRVVTSTLAFEGGGRVVESAGGYEDWRRRAVRDPEAEVGRPRRATRDDRRGKRPKAAGSPRLSYREQQELDALPTLIERLETEQRELEARAADPGLYRADPAEARRVLERLAALPADLERAYARWAALDGKEDTQPLPGSRTGKG